MMINGRYGSEIFDPVVVHSLVDIKRIIADFDPCKNVESVELPLSATIRAITKDGSHDVQVTSRTKSKSKREYLIDGFDAIKKWMENEEKMRNSAVATEVNGVAMRPAIIGNGGKGTTWVDKLITQWLGGYREDLFIYWDINDNFLYKYDIYHHKLTRIKK